MGIEGLQNGRGWGANLPLQKVETEHVLYLLKGGGGCASTCFGVLLTREPYFSPSSPYLMTGP